MAEVAVLAARRSVSLVAVVMYSLDVLQNRAAKFVLDRPVYSSSTQALLDLNSPVPELSFLPSLYRG